MNVGTFISCNKSIKGVKLKYELYLYRWKEGNFLSMNIAMIQGLGKQMTGNDISNDEAQSIMNSTGGGNEGQVNSYFTNKKSQNDANSAVTDAANTAQTNFTNLNTANNKSVTDFLGNYKTDVGNAISTANTTFKLPQLEDAVTGLTSRINDLSNNTSNSAGGAESGTGLGGYNSEAQVGEEINSRELPMLNAASANLNTASGLAQQQETIALQPDQTYEDLLKTNITTAMQGLTATQQTEMQGIIAKLNAGVTLTTAEMQTGEDYAKTILTNANNITLQNLKNQYTPIPQNNTIVNPATGQAINPTLLANENGGIYTPSQ